MNDNKKIAWASSTLGGHIWIPPNGRPFWTHHNAAGNCGPHLTDEELDKHGLSRLKEFEFSETWAKCHKADHERAMAKTGYGKNSVPKDYKLPEGFGDPKPWDDDMEKIYQRARKANRKLIEKYSPKK
jgi:hypothetical protein